MAADGATPATASSPVGFGQTATVGTFAAGVALMLRNVIQDQLGRHAVIVAALFGSLTSALTSAPAVARMRVTRTGR